MIGFGTSRREDGRIWVYQVRSQVDPDGATAKNLFLKKLFTKQRTEWAIKRPGSSQLNRPGLLQKGPLSSSFPNCAVSCYLPSGNRSPQCQLVFFYQSLEVNGKKPFCECLAATRRDFYHFLITTCGSHTHQA